VGLLDSLLGGARMSDPVPGQAQIVSATAHHGRGIYQSCNLSLVVQADGIPPTAVQHSCIAPAAKWPTPGLVVPVTVDRANPQTLRIEWDHVESGADRAARNSEAIAELMRRQSAPPAQASPPAPPAATPAATSEDDLVEELTRLAQLHASGALTDEEFAAAKQRVLEDD
jgi:Short C-terminal domain